MNLRRTLSSALAFAASLTASSAFAADILAPVPMRNIPVPLVLPAVSAVNAKIAIFGGFMDTGSSNGGYFGVEGALSVPIAHRYGLQIDGRLASQDGEVVGGVAGHLFWRDPRSALLGIYAAWDGGSGTDSWRVAAEGEAYFGAFSLEGLLGWEHDNSDGRIFGLVDAAFYLNDNLRLAAGYRYWGARSIGALGAEWLMPSKLLGNAANSLFVEGRVGSDSYAAVWGGIRFYVGPDKSLIRRHREDDPRVRGEGGTSEMKRTDCTFSIVSVC